ncbi:polycomb group RING finger protein 3 [Astyanax mexicanus]|uniref:Polycomb group RING finger protein 3 n=2 Tax=Astyanax mexicanus TaxID=7994 RepID=A0A8T2MCU6_ASTMX|nr:polycomb group RING finger protein 3 [Astyanax mexicanus]
MEDFFGTGMIVVAFKQSGTVDCARETLKRSVKGAASWLEQAFRTLPGKPSGPAAFRVETRFSAFLTSSVASMSGSSVAEGRANPEMLTRKIKLWDINAHITCRLCEGYLIDATTVTECLHTFCRSCLVKYLEENNTCPTCRIVIHQSHPLQYIGHDRTMQDIVYKLVPGLQEAELRKQRDFYQKLGMEVPGDIKGELCNMKPHLDTQRNGDVKPEDGANKEGEEKPEEDNDYHRSDEQVSICLECNSSKLRGLKRKWIRCSAQATVLHLKKFIAKKLNLTSFNELDILCNEEILGKDHTLKFVVVTRWRFKKSPLLLHYRPKMDLL